MSTKILKVIPLVTNFDEVKKSQLKVNVKEARDQRFIRDKNTNKKLENFAEKFGFSIKSVINNYEKNAKFRAGFIKDPSKQGCAEKTALDLIKQWDGDIINYYYPVPKNEQIYVVNGEITTIRQNDLKNLDLQFFTESKHYNCSLKHIGEAGGAQDNQYNDIRNFLRNCAKKNYGNEYFLAIVDGQYFENKVELLNAEFGSKNVKVLSVNKLYEYLVENESN